MTHQVTSGAKPSSLTQTASAVLLKLPHIAAWQIAHPPAVAGPTPNEPIVAALPAMQRGAVWKPKQVEMLWDSIARGFPVGAFLLAPYDAARGEQAAKHGHAAQAANYHLLDGQQRSTAIALGFLNPWTLTSGETTSEELTAPASAVLWVDLAPAEEKSDAEFVFRVVTRSHPWGYRRSNAEETLSVSAIRKALDEGFRPAMSDEEMKKRPPHEIPLTHVWPADAVAPVPLVFVIEALMSETADSLDQVTRELQKRLEKLPFWNAKEGSWPAIRKKVVEALDASEGIWPILVERLRASATLTANYGVPALILPQTARPDSGSRADPLETLFIRVNQAGTRLEGEELIYSILKSSWTDAPQFVEQLAHRLTHPPRLVMLATRLVLAGMQSDTDTRPPATPDVAQFRRLVHGQDKDRPDFKARLTGFVRGEAKAVFEEAKTLLVDTTLPGGEYALPPVLAFELAHKSPDVALLLLYWVMRMREAKLVPTGITAIQRRRLLGFLTALAWFAPDPGNAVAVVWPDLKQASPKTLPDFFARPAFEKMLKLGRYGKLLACPLPTPDVLETVIRNRVTAPQHAEYAGFKDSDSTFWKKWNWYDWLQRSQPGVLKDWFAQHVDAVWQSGEGVDKDLVDLKRDEAWRHFSDQLRNKKSLLLYVQRAWLNKWFPGYDPSVPDQIEDKNRPWDYDHIHPQRYMTTETGGSRRDIPQIIWDWHGSIGNFRAWPLEANRSDGDLSPKTKLSDVSDQEKRYHMATPQDECDASFVGYQKDDWDDWCASVPKEVESGEKPVRYLAYSNYGAARQALVRAITTRFCKLYRHWYEGLKIGDLMP